MRRLSSIIGLLGLSLSLFAQSPHGKNFTINCADCHTADSWEIPAANWNSTARFSHDETTFPLEGGHEHTDCRFCHETLIFEEAGTSCISCHTDIHHMTVGNDCARCHTSENWLVDNITELHQENGFPLLGAHAQISCVECHTSESGLQFTRIGNECINCHLDDYQATTSPNHMASGYSTECLDCHNISAFEWNSGGIIHDFFPLEKGHNISDCSQCHTNGVFENTPTDCFSCHQDDYENALNPNHQALNFGTDCASCHTLDIDWMPSTFDHDAMFFPIYSGKHRDEWNSCTDCHTTGNLNLFSCIDCHEHNNKNELDREHDEESGYSYVSTECFRCHPKGDE